MEVTVINENGYIEALFGLGLSFGLTTGKTITDFTYDTDLQKRLEGVALRLVNKNPSEAKFLRQCLCIIDVNAPRFWWPECDQYKIATVTQSESTRHTLGKKEFTWDDFEHDEKLYPLVDYDTISKLNAIREKYGWDSEKLRANLPEAYLQRRILSCNYATLRNIFTQRKNHKLWQWRHFIRDVYLTCCHQKLLEDLVDNDILREDEL